MPRGSLPLVVVVFLSFVLGIGKVTESSRGAVGYSEDSRQIKVPNMHDRLFPSREVKARGHGRTVAAGQFLDCNSNGIADDDDIASGTSTDCDGNGVPDECDLVAGMRVVEAAVLFESGFWAEANNDFGQMAGWLNTNGPEHAGLWLPEPAYGLEAGEHDLGTLGGGNSHALGINSRGQVVGESEIAGDMGTHAFLWLPQPDYGMSAGMYDPGTLGGDYSSASGVNNLGQVVGYSDLTGGMQSHAFLWLPKPDYGLSAGMHDLGTVDGTWSAAAAINNLGQVVGHSSAEGGSESHAFLWLPESDYGMPTGMHDLGVLEGYFSMAMCINDHGHVVGVSDGESGMFQSAFLWLPHAAYGMPAGMNNLGALGGNASLAHAINNSGQIVGEAETADWNMHAFLWLPESAYGFEAGMNDLNDGLESTSEWELWIARKINSTGQVLGDGQPDWFVLELDPGADCNENGVLDECDIDDGFSLDCNVNGIPDECDASLLDESFAVERFGPGLYSVDVPSGDLTWIGDMNRDVSGAFGLDADPDTGQLYAVVACSNGIPTEQLLVTVERTTAAVEIVGPVDQAGLLADIAFDDDGTLYGVLGNVGATPGAIVTISTDDASIDSTGIERGLGSGQSIAFHHPSGLMYHAYGSVLETIDLGTATISPISEEMQHSYNAMMFRDTDQPLWASSFGDWYAIDRYTGDETLVGTNGMQITGLATISSSLTRDCNRNCIADECDLSCGPAGGWCDVSGCGTSTDCNNNDIPDECDVTAGTSSDCNENLVPDECELAWIVPLETLSESMIEVSGMNNNRQVVGTAQTADYYQRAVIWTDGQLRTLGTLGGNDSWGYAINDQGQVVGESCVVGSIISPFLWDSGVMLDLGDLGGDYARATAINDSGYVVGAGRVADGWEHAFLWLPEPSFGMSTGIHDLGLLPGDSWSEAVAVNGMGQVVGASIDSSWQCTAFIWLPQPAYGLPAGMTGLGTLGGDQSNAFAIDDNGRVIGDATTSMEEKRAFLWLPEPAYGYPAGMNDLGTLGGGAVIEVMAVNASLQVVGSAITASGEVHAFLWLPESAYGMDPGMHDLGTLGGTYSFANSINDNGQVVGDADTAIGESHAFVWLPQPAYGLPAGIHNLEEIWPVSESGWQLDAAELIDNTGRVVVKGDPGVPDWEYAVLKLAGTDYDGNGVLDECEADCNANAIPDHYDIAQGTSTDCNTNGIPDECEPDCNGNNVPDEWDIAEGTSADCEPNGIPDECEADCNSNGLTDLCDIRDGTSTDCNSNAIPDECDISDGTSWDCNNNGIPDECDLAEGTSHDCNNNARLDECDILIGSGVYVVKGDDPGLCTFDVNDATLTTVAFMDQSVECAQGLASHPATGLFYAIVSLQGQGSPFLARVNRLSAEVEIVGELSETLSDLAFSEDGVLYGVVAAEDGLPVGHIVIVSTSDAAILPTGISAEAGRGQSIAFDPQTGWLYHTGTTELGRTILETIDLSTGSIWTAIGDLGNVPVEVLTFQPDGEWLWSCAVGVWVVIDPTTGYIEFVNYTGDYVTGMTWLTGSNDCNLNATPDECDTAAGTSLDCQPNGIPDECDGDCNMNRIADDCDIAEGTSLDCQSNGIPDECDISGETSQDCNTNGVPDECDLATGSQDINANGIPDECEYCAAPRGDADADTNGYVDLDDYAVMVPCLDGPAISVEPACGTFDLDGDCDVDLGDFAEFQRSFTGPPPPEACCLPNGACIDVSPDDCLLSGGVPQGMDTDCSNVSCPQPQACCYYPEGTCTDELPDNCTGSGGLPQGDGTNCVTTQCPEACCLPNGDCIDVEWSECLNASGAPQGPGTECSSVACPQPQACCYYPQGTCSDELPDNCTTNGGLPQGEETSCATTECPQACCLPNGVCIDVGFSECLNTNGTPQGAGTNCSSISCPQPQACCYYPEGTCTDEMPEDCTSNGGLPQGEETVCVTYQCPQACCMPDDSCIDMEPDECDVAGGFPMGAGTQCATTSCDEPLEIVGSWKSWKYHGSEVGNLYIELPQTGVGVNAGIETRQDGITILTCTFTTALSLPSTADIVVQGCVNGPYYPRTVSLDPTKRILTMEFSGIPNGEGDEEPDRYVVTVSASVTSLTGAALESDRDVEVIGQYGNVSTVGFSALRTDTNDINTITAMYNAGASLDQSTAKYDIMMLGSSLGQIDAADAASCAAHTSGPICEFIP